jgi:hypothetical protein
MIAFYAQGLVLLACGKNRLEVYTEMWAELVVPKGFRMSQYVVASRGMQPIRRCDRHPWNLSDPLELKLRE